MPRDPDPIDNVIFFLIPTKSDFVCYQVEEMMRWADKVKFPHLNFQSNCMASLNFNRRKTR
jgi:hypothetical protein